MRRKKVKKVYMQKSKARPVIKTESKPSELSTRRQSISLRPPRRQSTVSRSVRMKTHSGLGINLPKVFPDFPTEPTFSNIIIRKHLQIVSGTNAALSWLLSIIGYFDVADLDESQEVKSPSRDTIRSLVCGLSVLQLILIVSYSTSLLQYLECLRIDLRLSPIPVLPLQYSPRALAACVVECSFHMLVLPPRLSVQAKVYMETTYSLLSLNDFLYMMILLRNYHSLQFLFWYSPFSTLRSHFFASLCDVSFSNLYVLKCYLTAYSLKLVLGVYTAIVIISGISVYVVEKGTPAPDFDDVVNGLWIVAYTQATVGYGEIAPITYFGRVTMIISCFIGTFILSIIIGLSSSTMSLNLTECTMYSELVYSKYKRKYTKGAVLMIQKWWKLMLMRMHRIRDAHTIIAFYNQLRVYGSDISACQRVKDRRFERQIQAFEDFTTKEFRSIREYMQPILTAEALVCCRQTREIMRTQYQIKLKVKTAFKATRKYRKKNKDGASVSSVTFSSQSPEPALFKGLSIELLSVPRTISVRATPSPRSNIKELAKAKVRAHQKLIGRLLKEDSLPDRSSVNTSRSASPFPASYEL